MHPRNSLPVAGEAEPNLLAVARNWTALDKTRVDEPLHMLGNGALELTGLGGQADDVGPSLGDRRQQMHGDRRDFSRRRPQVFGKSFGHVFALRVDVGVELVRQCVKEASDLDDRIRRQCLGPPTRVRRLRRPQPQDGAAAATVEAASLKNLDRGLVSGTHYGSASLSLPIVAGIDGVARLDDGRLVYTHATAPSGLMAERTLIDPRQAVELPAGLDPVLGAAVPNPGLSAWFSLEYAARIRPGHNVLVLGATGVTGSIAVRLAKIQFGAGRVVVAGRRTTRLDWLLTVGADHAIPLGTDDVSERIAAEHDSYPIDVVLDYLWGSPAEQVLAALGNNDLAAEYHATRYVQVGSMAGPNITLPANILRSAGIELIGQGIGSVPTEALARVGTDLLPRLFAMAADGRLRIATQARPLSDVEQLWTAAEPSGSRIVLVP
jgi:NADPH:quinone reductase-like Zn-dependent oxidoreductase